MSYAVVELGCIECGDGRTTRVTGCETLEEAVSALHEEARRMQTADSVRVDWRLKEDDSSSLLAELIHPDNSSWVVQLHAH